MNKMVRLLWILGLTVISAPAWSEPPSLDIAQTVNKVPLEEDVSPEDAIDSMKLRANMLNFKLVAHQPLSKEIESMGLETGRMEIFQFCDPRIARDMVTHDINFSAYLPCRIALVEDKEGKFWLISMKLDMFIGSAKLPPELQKKATKVRDTINSIMEAGATGDL